MNRDCCCNPIFLAIDDNDDDDDDYDDDGVSTQAMCIVKFKETNTFK